MKIFRQLILVLASLAVFSSCVKDVEKTVATAIMTDKQSLEFGIEDELVQSLVVYADAPWTVETPSWITVDPASGSAGETEVAVTAKANIREALADRPRTETITFKGFNLYADATVTVFQNGDKYRDLVEGTLADAFAQATETFVGVKDIQVVALTSDGFVVKDETAISYVAADKPVAVGDKGSVYAYVSSLNGTPSLKNTDKVTVTANAAVDYSGATDITSTLQTYAPEQIELVTITGKLASKKITEYSEDGSATGSVYVELLNAHSSLNMSELDGWLVEAKGYVFGKNGDAIALVPVSLTGIQSLETIYFADDFEWIQWATVDAVGKDDQSSSVTNIWKADWADAFFAEFNKIGYQYLWSTVGDKEFKEGVEQVANPSIGKEGSMYACKNYLKFGQTSYSGALRLPALSSIQGTANIQIDFDWCWQVTGSNNPDIMTMSVQTTHGKFEQTGLLMSEALESQQSQDGGQSHLAWQHATVILTEATPETVLTIRPTYADPDKQNPERHQNRWYLDNIKIIEYTGNVSVAQPTEAEITISMENNITFEAAPAEPKTFTFSSDQVATLTIEADWMSFVESDGTKVKELSIAAGAPTVVTVACDENTASESRTADILITSGLTEETIPVTQMSPGQKVESFVSIIGGNSGNVTFDEGSFELSVQANVDFEFESDAAWATVQAMPESKAVVEVKKLVVNYEANADFAERVAHIRVYNAAENLESVYTLKQDGFSTGTFFQDDFSWVTPLAKAEGADDSVGTDNPSGSAPNVWKMASSADFFSKFNEIGYSYLYGTTGSTEYVAGPAAEPNASVGKDGSIYIQDSYLKFGQTSYNLALVLPALSTIQATETVLVEFDWCWQVTGAFKPDLMTLSVDATVGQFALTGNSTSEAIESSQSAVDGESHLAWQHASVILTGATAETILTIRPTNADPAVQNAARKQNRWYIDNIKVTKYEGVVPGQPEPLNVSWLFSADAMNDATTGYAATFGTTAGVEDKTAGDGGQYVNANSSGSGKITYVQVDKTSLPYTSDKNGNPYKTTRITGGTGHPYVTGMWIGDYWLFEATDGTTYPAGTKVNISYLTRTSATGIKYWRLEYLDGADWKPAMAVSTVDGTDLQYNVAMNSDGKTDIEINATVTLTNPTENVKFRMVCVGGSLANGNAMPEGMNGGTCRIAGAEGTSPAIKVVTE